MEEPELPISGENIPPALLSAIVDLSAKHEALTQMVIDYLIKGGEKQEDLMATYDNDYYAAKDRLLEELYAHYGDSPLPWMIGRFEES